MIKLVNALGATKILPLSMAWRNIPLSIARPTVRLYGDGSIPVGKSSLEPRQFTLSGSIYYPDKHQVVGELDSILSFLQYPPIQCYRNEASERFMYGHPTAINYDQLDGGAEIALDIVMLATDPYWYGIETDKVVSGTGTLEVLCTNSGNAPTLPIIRGTVGGDITITNTHNGHKLELLGLIAGDSIYVDCVNMYTEINGMSALHWVNDAWLLDSFIVAPGNNKITIEGPGTKTITLTYRPRWY